MSSSLKSLNRSVSFCHGQRPRVCVESGEMTVCSATASRRCRAVRMRSARPAHESVASARYSFCIITWNLPEKRNSAVLWFWGTRKTSILISIWEEISLKELAMSEVFPQTLSHSIKSIPLHNCLFSEEVPFRFLFLSLCPLSPSLSLFCERSHNVCAPAWGSVCWPDEASLRLPETSLPPLPERWDWRSHHAGDSGYFILICQWAEK